MINVSRETKEKLDDYLALSLKWNARINLFGPSTAKIFRSRHIDDSLQIAQICLNPVGHWVDLGSGGGLPGLVLAIAFNNHPVAFTLIESDQRKAEFLRTVVRDLELTHVTVVCERIESLIPLSADHISARALAPLPKLLSLVHRHLRHDGTAWLMKGRSWCDEYKEAQKNWRFDLQAFASTTDTDAAILKVSGVRHA